MEGCGYGLSEGCNPELAWETEESYGKLNHDSLYAEWISKRATPKQKSNYYGFSQISHYLFLCIVVCIISKITKWILIKSGIVRRAQKYIRWIKCW
jgi:hypothetical protein